MIRTLGWLPWALALAPCSFSQAGISADPRATLPVDAPPGIELIDRSDLAAHAAFLASDELGGRLTASPGQLEAARYIAERFEAMGLEPLGDRDAEGRHTWYQSYPVVRTTLDPAATSLILGENAIETGFAVLPAADDDANTVVVEGRWVRVQTRGEAPDLAGAIPVVVLETPRLRTRDINLLFGVAMSRFTRSRGMATRLQKLGAAAVVFCVLDDESGITTTLNYVGLAPGKDLLAFEGDRGMADMADNWRAPIPQVFLSSAVSKQVLAALEQGDVTGGLRLKVDVDGEAQGVNAVACLRGSDPRLAEQAVIYTAHMDHVGLRMDGEVFNGADDNASGTAGLLEIAQAYAGAGERPRRSVVFLSVSGEELGLWGSSYFTSHPTWPLDKIVANINTDMIGRSGPESEVGEVTVTPSYRHGMFSTLVRDSSAIGAELGIAFTNGDKYYTRSDHFNFAEQGIPVVFFCSGEHEDYHQVTDHADKLDYQKMEKIARLAYWTGWQVAQSESRPERLGRSVDWLGTPRQR